MSRVKALRAPLSLRCDLMARSLRDTRTAIPPPEVGRRASPVGEGLEQLAVGEARAALERDGGGALLQVVELSEQVGAAPLGDRYRHVCLLLVPVPGDELSAFVTVDGLLRGVEERPYVSLPRGLGDA